MVILGKLDLASGVVLLKVTATHTTDSMEDNPGQNEALSSDEARPSQASIVICF